MSQLLPVRVLNLDWSVGYRVVGSGTPLLLITGFSGTMDDWSPAFVDALASRHRVVVFDNAGVGVTGTLDRSPLPPWPIRRAHSSPVSSWAGRRCSVGRWVAWSPKHSPFFIRHRSAIWCWRPPKRETARRSLYRRPQLPPQPARTPGWCSVCCSRLARQLESRPTYTAS